jgi:hypothetical protein
MANGDHDAFLAMRNEKREMENGKWKMENAKRKG